MRALTVYQERILSNMEPPERVRTAPIAVVEMRFLPIAHFLSGMSGGRGEENKDTWWPRRERVVCAPGGVYA